MSKDAGFDWQDYSPQVRQHIHMAWRRVRGLHRCSLCRKRAVNHGVLVPPGLRQLQPPPEARPLGYALCTAHSALSAAEVGDLLMGTGWRAHDTP